MQPARHALGALLLEQGRVGMPRRCIATTSASAAPAARADPPGQSVGAAGLLDCLERRGETAEAALIRQRVDSAAARADVPVSVSCFCAREAA